MPKKKKTQLKPVARGFSVTSVPKKPSLLSDNPEVTAAQSEAGTPKEGILQAETTQQAHGSAEGVASSHQTAEEQSMQDLIDKLQEKAEKEIVRMVKAIETDRRLSGSLPLADLDARIVNQILSMAREPRSSEATRLTDDSDDKVLARLGITYGVLRRLGYTEDVVERCLRAIDSIDLDDAYEWLLMNCTDDELRPHSFTTESRMSMQRPASTAVPSTPSDTATLRTDTLLSTLTPPSQPGDPRLHGSAHNPIKSGHTKDPTFTPESPEDNPNLQYVRLKMQIDDIEAPRKAKLGATDSFTRDLQARLQVVKAHYLFDERDANNQYLSERRRADAATFQARLRGDLVTTRKTHDALDVSALAKPEAIVSPSTPHGLSSAPLVKEPPEETHDIFDSDDAEGGGLFELLDEMPSTDVTETGVTIKVRDMPLPKGKFERTSKAFLRNVIDKLDKFAVLTYQIISGASRAKRASLTIRWGLGNFSEWAMEDVACYDTSQAEQYIATVALYDLTFPTTEGFASATAAPGNGHTFFRQLSPAFRELWDELEATRKSSDDAVNRSIWTKLRNIVEAKCSRKKPIEGSRQPAVVVEGPNPDKGFKERDSSEQIKSAFEARQSSMPYQEMLSQRNDLPIAPYRERIVECLEISQILVLSGETGCGKSTQVPAFILEDQLSRGKACRIYCTEPRRISAISLAHRVSRELGDPPGAVGTNASLVGYSIRLENHTSRNTRLAYVTYGIALRMLEGASGSGVALDEITHIIIDEVHERSIESDFLLIVLKALLLQRPQLKVVLMSATVDAEKISQYFGGCPVLHVPGRTFPVEVRYLEDAVELTQWSITESSPYARRLTDKFFRGKNIREWSEDTAGANLSDQDDDSTPGSIKLEKRYSPRTASTINLLDERVIPYELIMRLLEHVCFEQLYIKYSAAILVFLPGISEIRRLNDLLSEHPVFGSGQGFVIYPLHSSISSDNQGAVFEIPPSGVRKIVLATNIAETGITIPDITCVIDSGKHKEMRFDEKRQLSRLVETYVARSNAAQRRGRSGRVQDGLCFHLFTKLRHDTRLAEHPDPEIMRLSLSDLALRIKIMKVDMGSSIEDVFSQALDPPSAVNVQRAVSVLVEVRALTPDEDITSLGRLLSGLPTDVHIGKFLLMATMFRCLDPALTIAATLNSKSPFLAPFGHEEEADRAKVSFRTDNSDFMTMHNAFTSWRRASSDTTFVRKFCRTNFLSQQNLQQIEDLRQQFLAYLVDSGFLHADKTFVKQLSRARFSRGRTKFITVPPELNVHSGNATLVSAALAAGLYPKILSIDPTHGHLTTITNPRTVSFHPSSVNFKRRPLDFGVGYLAFFTLMHSKKLYVWETGPADDTALLLLCGDCSFKVVSDAVLIDRKIKFRVPAKANLAFKYLRMQLAAVLNALLRNKPLTKSQEQWLEIATVILGKTQQDHNSTQQSVVLNIVPNATTPI